MFLYYRYSLRAFGYGFPYSRHSNMMISNAAATLTVIPGVIPVVITATWAGYIKPKHIILFVIHTMIPVVIAATIPMGITI